MKRFLVLLTCLTLSACAPNGPYATLKVSGMSCEACASSVSSNLKKIEGVTDVMVNVETGTVDIFTKKETKIDTVAVQKMIDLSGYKLNSITLKK